MFDRLTLTYSNEVFSRKRKKKYQNVLGVGNVYERKRVISLNSFKTLDNRRFFCMY
jgi:hypothetical protein